MRLSTLRSRWLAVLGVMLGVTLAAIGSPAVASEPTSSAALRGELTVSAAASLTESFTAIGRQFRKANPKVRLRFNFASTTALVTQIQAGAPVDVFASADLTSQDRLSASGNLTTSPRVFARNAMQIAVKPGNPRKVRNVADLAALDTVALCAAAVPCGVYAASVLALNKTTIAVSATTRGVDAKATIAQVALGDAEAALVYVTDVRAAGNSVTGVMIPAALNVRATYGVAVIRGTANRSVALAFVNFLSSADAQQTLREFGFLAP